LKTIWWDPEAFSDNSNYRHLSDTVITFNPTAKLSLMANFDYGHDRVGTDAKWWTGIAGYIKYAPTINGRSQPAVNGFNDHDGFETGTATALERIYLHPTAHAGWEADEAAWNSVAICRTRTRSRIVTSRRALTTRTRSRLAWSTRSAAQDAK
jgi:hypothetical protein